MKVSYYNVITEPVNKMGSRLLYNLRTESFAIIDSNTYLKLINNNLDISDKTKEQLNRIKAIVPFEENELNEILNENRESIADRKTLSFTIFPSANCQLGCVYCGQEHTPTYLNQSLHEHTLKHLEDSLRNSEKNHLAINWFGAEPLMGVSTIKELTPKMKELAKKYNCTYSSRITTNGLLLNIKNFKMLIDNDVKDITISLDGTKEFHDNRRFTKGGNASFDVIFNNLKSVFNTFNMDEEGVEIMVRINVDTHNKDGVIPLLNLFAESNFQKQIKHYDIAPIHSWGNDAHVRAIPIEEFAKMKINFTLTLLKLGLTNKVPIPKRVKVICQAVTFDSRYMDAKGDLYDCSELPLVPVHKEKFKIGNIESFVVGLDNKRNYTTWNDEIEQHTTPCGKCKILPVCGGGCPKSWRDGHVACPDYKYNIRDLLLMAYLHSKDSEKFLNELQAIY